MAASGTKRLGWRTNLEVGLGHTVETVHWEATSGAQTGARASTRRYVSTSCSAVLKRGWRDLACRRRLSPSEKRTRAPRRIRPNSKVPKNTTGTDCPFTAATASTGAAGMPQGHRAGNPVHGWVL